MHLWNFASAESNRKRAYVEEFAVLKKSKPNNICFLDQFFLVRIIQKISNPNCICFQVHTLMETIEYSPIQFLDVEWGVHILVEAEEISFHFFQIEKCGRCGKDELCLEEEEDPICILQLSPQFNVSYTTFSYPAV